MIVEIVIAVLATTLAAVSAVAGVIGLLGLAGAAVFTRCPGCDRFALRRRRTAGSGAERSSDRGGECAHCRHPHLTHPVSSVLHPSQPLVHH